MYYTYILRSQKDGKFYTGITNNIDDRIKKHNHGYRATQSTMNRGLFDLVFVQISENRIEARRLEKHLKSGMGREIKRELLIKEI